MQKIKKITETIFLFIIIMLLICLGISLYYFLSNKISFNQILGKTGLYFLYTIGYGALEGDAIIQNILAIIGIVALALMSTFLTINLFWRLDDVILAKNITKKDDELFFSLQNNGKTICNIQISFMLFDTNTLESNGKARDFFIPMLIKKAKINLNVDLNDTFWYQAIYNLLTNPAKKLYAILSFVDTKNGQSSLKVQEFNINNIEGLTYQDLVKPINITNELLQPIEYGGSIVLNKEGKIVKGKYHFPKNAKKNENFVMAFYNFHASNLNLEKYNKNTTYLTFKIKALQDLHVTLEIKTENCGAYSQDLLINKDTDVINIYLSSININLEKVGEICFTIFPNNNKLENELEISDLQIITK